jgi:hypothetical protein
MSSISRNVARAASSVLVSLHQLGGCQGTPDSVAAPPRRAARPMYARRRARRAGARRTMVVGARMERMRPAQPRIRDLFGGKPRHEPWHARFECTGCRRFRPASSFPSASARSHIVREAIAESDNPVLLYSIGKDSSVLLHLALKAFHPAKPPFPLLHVDTTWKFRDMIAFRDRRAEELGIKLIAHLNQDGLDWLDSGARCRRAICR